MAMCDELGPKGDHYMQVRLNVPFFTKMLFSRLCAKSYTISVSVKSY